MHRICHRHSKVSPFISVAAAVLISGMGSAVRITHAQQTVFKEPAGSDPSEGRDDSGQDRRPFLGQIYPEDLSPWVKPNTAFGAWFARNHIQAFGWLDGGVTSISHVSGQAVEAPVSNRFSNQAMLDAAWLTLERPTSKSFSWGFRTDFYVGSDAALLRPRESFGPKSTRWGTDFRQAYLSIHIPGSLRGTDLELGRINVPTGYETLMAPYRPIYSEGYFWIHYEVGSTSVQATLHPSARLDAVAGVVMGYNTIFTLRGSSPSYVGRLIYRPRGEKARQLFATVYTGPQPVSSQPGHVGSWQTISELQYREVWDAAVRPNPSSALCRKRE